MPTLNHDAVTQLLFDQIVKGVDEINVANETLLAEEEAGAGLREIDKALKEADDDFKKEFPEVSKSWAKAQDLQKKYKEALENARNAYRVQVLKEEAKEINTNDVDKDAVKETRKVVMGALDLIKNYAQANGKKDIVEWAGTFDVPQVGRKGSSVVGQKKPRAYVSVNGTRHESFGEAAKAVSENLSTDDNKVTVSSGDLVAAWTEAGESNEFDYNGLTIGVELKQKAAA